MSGLPWRRWMRLGLGELRLAPRDFWAMTPRELAAAFDDGAAPLGRAALDDLMRAYPDGR